MLGVPFLDDAINKWFRPQQFDDPVDRLNYFVTSTLLAFFATMVSAKQYVGSPIQCWMPTEFKGGWEQYVEDYCFIQNTYYVPLLDEIPVDQKEREDKEFGYYQWVPIMLALQAVMFYLPNWIWKVLHQQSGVDLRTAISDAAKLRALKSSDRKEEVEKLASYISETLEINETRRVPRRVLFIRVGRHLGSYVCTLYVFVKFLYVLNIFIQFVILNSFLGTTYSFWGLDILVQLIQGRDWMDTHVFPRVTLCDFQVRRLANLHNYTVQCVLLPPGARERMIVNYLNQDKLSDLHRSPDTMSVIRRFANVALYVVLLLRFVEGHAGAIVARDLTAHLFSNYLNSFSNVPMLRDQDVSGTKSTSPGGDDYSGYPSKQLSPPYKIAPEQQHLLEPDSGLPKHKHI
ncbi:hypothetical protein FO519_004374 [Halicephalobus sp. NKZ332]|nr:hypothetical protein FO519_004374 [Halicephalobus sp. NKZ332]